MGFYPLPLSEAQRIRRFLGFPDAPSSAIDPCVGDGVAFEVITHGAEVIRYGLELDAFRAEQVTGLGMRMAVRVAAAIYLVVGSPPIFGKLRNPG